MRLDRSSENFYKISFTFTHRLIITKAFKIFLLMIVSMLLNVTFLIKNATAADHISVTREIFLGRANANAVTQTKDGGYIVVGIAQDGAWATRIDSEGKEQWTHYSPHQADGFKESYRPGYLDAKYRGAAMLPDDSVILCGEKGQIIKKKYKHLGILTHIDKAGKVLSEEFFSPNFEGNNDDSGFRKCISIDKRVALFGYLNGSDKNPPQDWLILIDEFGKLQSEKLMPCHSIIGITGAYELSERDFVVSGEFVPASVGFLNATSITHFDHLGNLLESRIIAESKILVEPLIKDDIIRLIPSNVRDLEMMLFTKQLSDLRQTIGSTKSLSSRHAYLLRDNSIAIFGAEAISGPVLSAAIMLLNPDLTEKAVFRFSPEVASNKLIDAIPTGQLGEFVTLRNVISRKSFFGEEETRSGVVLAFVQLR